MPRTLIVLCLTLLARPLLAAELIDIGLTSSGARVQGVSIAGPSPTSPTVLLIGGMSGNDASVASVREHIQEFDSLRPQDRGFRLLAIPLANPDGTTLKFPPTGVAYRENATANVLWRWVGIHAPDLVLVSGNEDFGLAQALSQEVVAEVGHIPARRVPAKPGKDGLFMMKPGEPGISDAHRELDRRLARTPRQLADRLAIYYGHEFDEPLYIQSLALIAQIRLGHLDEVKRLVEPYVAGTKNSLENPSSLVLAGHMVFTELARRTNDPRYVQMVKKVADLGFEANGQMKESMPYHDYYSDSVFMGSVIAAQAGTLTGNRKYYDLAAQHIAYMQKYVLRPDGLYRHQPMTEAAWGRGNAFPAIGLALTLSEFPQDHPDWERLMRDYQAHMDVLARYQDSDGLWRNVIDYPGAYPEFSATAMIGFAMLRGVKSGWLPPEKFQPIVDRAWRAVVSRVGPEGHVVDACESTPKQKNTGEYLRRAALLGVDPRSGAMAMMFALEKAGL